MKIEVDKDFIKNFGNNVRKYRELKEYSMEHLANMCDMEYSQISRIELGKINTTINTANLIAKKLEIEISLLFDSENLL